MTKKELMAMLAKIKEKISDAFDKFMESADEAEMQRYENLLKEAHALEEQIALIEKEELEEKGIPGGEPKPAALTERQKFGRALVEAMSKGTTFSGALPHECAQNIQKKKEALARLRGLCSVHVASGEYTVYIEGEDATVNYIGEGSSITESTPTIKPLALGALKLAGLVKVSREYLNDLGLDVMGYIEEKLAKAFAKKEDNDIIFGAGTSSSKTAMRGIATNVSGAALITAASDTTVTWAEVKKLIQAIKAYRPNATLVCGQTFLDIVHEFKDGSNYLFAQNQPITQILGVKVVVSDVFPAIASEAVAAVVGDFSYYHILDRQSIEMTTLLERYADTDQIGIRAVERIDGDFLTDAFAVLKMKKTGA